MKTSQRCKIGYVQVVLSLFSVVFSLSILSRHSLCLCEKDPAKTVNP